MHDSKRFCPFSPLCTFRAELSLQTCLSLLPSQPVVKPTLTMMSSLRATSAVRASFRLPREDKSRFEFVALIQSSVGVLVWLSVVCLFVSSWRPWCPGYTCSTPWPWSEVSGRMSWTRPTASSLPRGHCTSKLMTAKLSFSRCGLTAVCDLMEYYVCKQRTSRSSWGRMTLFTIVFFFNRLSLKLGFSPSLNRKM